MNQHETLQRYMSYAGAPIGQFTYLGRFDGWEPLGRSKLVVWPSMNEAYLLSVEPTCLNIDFANRIAITSTVSSVNSGLDFVRFFDGNRQERCRITEIRPVDYKRMKEDLRQEKESQ